MIRSFKSKKTEHVYHGKRPKGFPAKLVRRSVVKLDQLNAAAELDDLRIHFSNHLEVLTGNRQGQHSIRINDQFRICFHWNKGNAEQVEIIDYH